MNVIDFKKITSAWEHSTEKFAFFRTWASNTYVSYGKLRDLDYTERSQITWNQRNFQQSPEYADWLFQWEILEYEDVLLLYSKMGWKLEPWMNEIPMEHNDDYDFFYYKITMSQIYDRLEAIEDDAEFCYALLCLISPISEDRKLYKEYVSKLITGLREAGLGSCLELENEKKQKAFIAMSFASGMNKARRRIEKAISDCGYEPTVIDVKEHNNQIVPEIYREIEASAFVVADLTGQRGGVYYEAGYAVAKGKELILCCRKDESDKVHFDVAQINTIFWDDEEELFERLKKRIQATVPIVFPEPVG